MPPTLRRLHPGPPVETTVTEAYASGSSASGRTPPPGRPWVSVCMVTSLDGSVALAGASGGLGNANDRAVLLAMRDVADVVVVGAGTARGEGYGPPKREGLRVGVATNSGRVDLDRPLFASGAGFVLAPESADIDESRVDVVRAGAATLDIAAAIARIHTAVPGVRHVHAEGGPTLNAALADADVVDELVLTWSPRIVGGDGPRLTTGAGERDRRYELAHLLADDDGYVFGRWVRRRDD